MQLVQTFCGRALQRKESITIEKPLRAKVFVGWVLLGVGASVGGLLGSSVGLPAAWLVGPMIVAVVFALSWRARLEVPRGVQRASQAVIGIVLAATFRPSVLPLIAADWLPVSLALVGTLLASFLAGSFLTRVARLDGNTAALGTLPGAASGMLAMSGPLGADPRLVALIQYGRVVLVILSATLISRFGLTPNGKSHGGGSGLAATAQMEVSNHGIWLAYSLTVLISAAGAWAGTKLRLPAGALLGPLIGGVALEELGVLRVGWPPGVPQVAYALLGMYVGLLFDPASVRRAGRLLPFVLASTLGLMAVCAGLGGILAALTGTDLLTAYLATTPGGIDSVAIIALGSGADASLVLAVQMLRLFAVVLAGPLIVRWWISKNQ